MLSMEIRVIENRLNELAREIAALRLRIPCVAYEKRQGANRCP
jgi:hypothetical protein